MTDEDKALVEQLYDQADRRHGSVGSLHSLEWKAANRIEDQAAEIEKLREALVQHNDRLRSAAAIAGRNGKDTNWLAFRGQVHFTLAEYHELAVEARAALGEAK